MDAMRRVHLVLLTVVACLAAAAIGLVAARAGDDGGGAGAAALPGATVSDAVVAPGSAFAGAERPQGIPTPDFTLQDQDGRTVRLSDTRGDVTVLTFLYTTCEDTCPITAQQIRGALDQLGHDVPVLAVSVDPGRDTPDLARRFLLEQKLTGRMSFLLGDRDRLAPIWKGYGIRPQGQGFDHSAHVVLIDRDGEQRIGFPVDQLTPEALAHDIRALEAEPA